MNDPHTPQFTRDYLTDGYLSYSFNPRNAESYLVHLFKVDAPSVQAIRHQSGAFYVLNRPSHTSPPALLVNGQDAWLLDYAVRSGGSVVPQQLWFPQGQGDRRRYVDQTQFRMPIFFANMGSLGIAVGNAVAGNLQLNGTDLPPQLADKTTIKIRIGVCTCSLPARSPSLTICIYIAVAGLSCLRTPGPTERSDTQSRYPREICQALGRSHTAVFRGAIICHETGDELWKLSGF
jgi:hypothetical protein